MKLSEQKQELCMSHKLRPCCCIINEEGAAYVSIKTFIWALRRLRKGRSVQLLARGNSKDNTQKTVEEFKKLLIVMTVPDEKYNVHIDSYEAINDHWFVRIDVAPAH